MAAKKATATTPVTQNVMGFSVTKEVPADLERGGVPTVSLVSSSSLPALEEPDFFEGQ